MARFGSRRNQVVRRRSDGRYDLVLEPHLREALTALLGELDDLLAAGPDDPGLRRLSPTAYPDDAERDNEYQLLAGHELQAKRREAIEAVLASLHADQLDDGDLWAWLQSLNALRLVVGTRLEIDDDADQHTPVDSDDPTAPLWSIYDVSTWLQHEIVRALQG